MKRMMALVLCVLMTLSLAACGEQKTYDEAQQLLAEDKFDEALALFQKIPDYADSSEKIEACKTGAANAAAYAAAVADMDSDNYKDAADAFLGLKDYKDSADKANECLYQYAVSLMDDDDYTQAKEIFDSISDYTATITGFSEKLAECNYGILRYYLHDNGSPWDEIDEDIADNTTLTDGDARRFIKKDMKDSDGNTYTMLVVGNSDYETLLYYFRKYTKNDSEIDEVVDCVDEAFLPLSAENDPSCVAVEKSYVEVDGDKYYVDLFMGYLGNKKNGTSLSVADIDKDTKWELSSFENMLDDGREFDSSSKEYQQMIDFYSDCVAEFCDKGDELLKDTGITLRDLGFDKLS